MAALAYGRAFRHAYHPSCGCHACGKSEAAAERDDELRATFRERLIETASFLSEVALNNEELDAAAAAVKSGDMAALGKVYQAAIEREADEQIEDRADHLGFTHGEAAEQLYQMHKPAAIGAAA